MMPVIDEQTKTHHPDPQIGLCLSDSTEGGNVPSFTIEDVRFEQNTKQMYDKVLESTPWFVRQKAQSNLDQAIAAEMMMYHSVLRERDIYQIVERTSPRMFLRKSLNILYELKSPESGNEDDSTDTTNDREVASREDRDEVNLNGMEEREGGEKNHIDRSTTSVNDEKDTSFTGRGILWATLLLFGAGALSFGSFNFPTRVLSFAMGYLDP